MSSEHAHTRHSSPYPDPLEFVLKVDRDAAADGKNTARERWRRAIFLTLRLQDGNTMLVDERVQHADAARKFLETQHWLELIDV